MCDDSRVQRDERFLQTTPKGLRVRARSRDLTLRHGRFAGSIAPMPMPAEQACYCEAPQSKREVFGRIVRSWSAALLFRSNMNFTAFEIIRAACGAYENVFHREDARAPQER
jgi:hypothetical protein